MDTKGFNVVDLYYHSRESMVRNRSNVRTTCTALLFFIQPISSPHLWYERFHPSFFISPIALSITTQVTVVVPTYPPPQLWAPIEPLSLFVQVAQMASFISPLTDHAVGAASQMADIQRKVDLLDQAKTVAECAAQLMYATKEGGGNPKVRH